MKTIRTHAKKGRAVNVKHGLRLGIRKAPKIETPKSVYTRKAKHARCLYDECTAHAGIGGREAL